MQQSGQELYIGDDIFYNGDDQPWISMSTSPHDFAPTGIPGTLHAVQEAGGAKLGKKALGVRSSGPDSQLYHFPDYDPEQLI